MPYSAKGAFKAIVDADRAFSAAVANMEHARHLLGVALDEMPQFLGSEKYDISKAIEAYDNPRHWLNGEVNHRIMARALECSPSSVSEWRRGRPITGKRLARLLQAYAGIHPFVHLIRPLS